MRTQMWKSFVCMLVLVFCGLGSGATTVIGDFETGLDVFSLAWDPGVSIAQSSAGATTGSQSMAITADEGWNWAVQANLDPASLEGILMVSLDITWVASEWDGSGGWAEFSQMAVNSDGPSGWQQLTADDPTSPGWPGGWGPWAGDNTRTLTWDVSGYDASGATWLQLVFATNYGSFTTAGNFYIDNVQLIGPDKPTVTLSSSAGGSLVDPGEGTYVVDVNSTMLLDVEVDDPNLFEFKGFQGALAGGSTPYLLTVTHSQNIRAVFRSLLDVIYVDDDAAGYQNGTADYPFSSVQAAIEVAAPGATVVVRGGTYAESLDLQFKSLTLTSVDPDPNGPVPADYPTIEGVEGEPVVAFNRVDDALLQGLILTGADCSIQCQRSSVQIENCLVVGNRARRPVTGGALLAQASEVSLVNCTLADCYGGLYGAGVYASYGSDVVILDSVLWNNLPTEVLTDDSSVVTINSSNVMGGYPGEGNLDEDPMFVLPGYWEHELNPGMVVSPGDYYAKWIKGDYHLPGDLGAGAVIGDFETGVDGFALTWEADSKPELAIAQSTIGATTGSGSLAISAPIGWAWAVLVSPDSLAGVASVSCDVTWIASEWQPQSGGWVQFTLLAANSDGPSGWQQWSCSDLTNPDSPGAWDPSWGDHTRTLTWDVSSYDSTGATWVQLIFSTNMGGFTTAGNYYIDNVQLLGNAGSTGGLGAYSRVP